LDQLCDRISSAIGGEYKVNNLKVCNSNVTYKLPFNIDLVAVSCLLLSVALKSHSLIDIILQMKAKYRKKAFYEPEITIGCCIEWKTKNPTAAVDIFYTGYMNFKGVTSERDAVILINRMYRIVSEFAVF